MVLCGCADGKGVGSLGAGEQKWLCMLRVQSCSACSSRHLFIALLLPRCAELAFAQPMLQLL